MTAIGHNERTQAIIEQIRRKAERVETHHTTELVLDPQVQAIIAELAQTVSSLNLKLAALEKDLADLRATYAPLHHVHDVKDLERAAG